jgi:hypothetical protein
MGRSGVGPLAPRYGTGHAPSDSGGPYFTVTHMHNYKNLGLISY